MTLSHSRTGRILVVDNNPRGLESIQTLLESKGYQIFSANTLEKAAELVNTEWVHLLVLDIRMEADLDVLDTSGLDFAATVDPLIAKIILTAYRSYETYKKALGPAAKSPAVDYVEKQEGPAKLLAAVERVFWEKIKINFDLEVRWQNGLSPEHLAQEVELQDCSVAVIASQVEDILCKLFFAASEIVVAPLIARAHSHLSSQSGSAVIRVNPKYKEGGWGAPVVVKIASRTSIITEADNYEQFVRKFVGDHRRTNLDQFAETHLLGGVIYSLVGTSLDETLNLARFYERHSAADIIPTLDNLFNSSCRLWYANRQRRQDVDFIQLYNQAIPLSVEKIKAALRTEHLSEFIEPLWLSFPGLGRKLMNPLKWFQLNDQWITSLYTCFTHGDLHSGNVLLDATSQIWLIDFYRTGDGHILRDIIELETDIKFNLLDAADPFELFKFEAALLAAQNMGDVLSAPEFSDQPELKKAFKVVSGLRGVARHLLGAEVEMKEYYWGLFLLTLNVIRLKSIERLKKRHALLAASLLAHRLQSWPGH